MIHDLAAAIDHTLLDPLADAAAVTAAVKLAVDVGCASVCLNPSRVRLASEILDGAGLPVCTVIGFPFGATTTATKVVETLTASDHGASEFDMVLDLGRFLDGDLAGAGADIAAVRGAVGTGVLKVIIESSALGIEQIRAAARLAVANGADFVKTSTGYHPSGGATVEAVAAIRGAVGPDIGVKASGGIATLADAEAMIEAGATRIGSSRTAAIVG